MVCIEMLRWGTAPGSKKLAQRPGLGSAAGRWTVDGGGGGEGGPAGVRREVAAAADWGSSDAVCALCPCRL